jgi:hypothetical protein
MQIFLKDWFRLESLEFGLEPRDFLKTAIRVASGVHESVFIILDFLAGSSP